MWLQKESGLTRALLEGPGAANWRQRVTDCCSATRVIKIRSGEKQHRHCQALEFSCQRYFTVKCVLMCLKLSAPEFIGPLDLLWGSRLLGKLKFIPLTGYLPL